MLTKEQYECLSAQLPLNLDNPLIETIKKATIIKLKKSDTLLNESSIDTKAYFIIKGSCVRFIITPNGDEKAIMFHTENFMPIIGNVYVGSQNSIVTYHIKANENTEVVEMDLSFVNQLQTPDKAHFEFAIQNAHQYLSILNQIQNHLIGLSSEDFFSWLMKEYSFIFQRFLSKDIASFMGVTPVWLSNIKRKLAKK